VAVLVVGVSLLQNWTLDWYALTPGEATSIATNMTISGARAEKPTSSIKMVDVWMQQLSVWDWIVLHAHSHVEFIPGSWMVDPGTPSSELDAQGYLDMDQSKQQAAVAALRALGWSVPRHDRGAELYGIAVPSAAHRAHLKVGDVVTTVDGRPVRTGCDMIRAVSAYPVGAKVVLGVDRVHYSAKGAVTWPRHALVTVTTTRRPKHVVAACPGVPATSQSFIGASVLDVYSYDMPVAITVKADGVGGPSSGLAMALTALDRLTKGSLTGGRSVAASGTIDDAGTVGDVGGIAEKAMAVANSGATIFLVPQVEYKVARAAAPASLTVIGVRSLAQAVAALRPAGAGPLVPLTTPR
jgi:Lon-like protease